MFLDDGRMLNTNGVAMSAPVFPNPLSDDVKLTGYENNGFINIGANVYNYKNVVSDGNYMWSIVSPGKINRFKIETGELESIPIGVNISSNKLVFDGKYVWILGLWIDLCIYRVNAQTLEVSKVTLENYVNNNINTIDSFKGVTINAGLYNGENIWLFVYSTPSLIIKMIKIDLQTEVATGYNISAAYGLSTEPIMLSAKNSIYLLGSVSILKFDLTTQQLSSSATIPTSILPSGSSYTTAIFDGKSIWMAPSKAQNNLTVANQIIEFNTKTNEVKGHLMQGENIGDCGAPTITERFMAASFDGRYVWFAPRNVNRILRLDTTNVSMKGYSLVGTNLGNVASITTPKFTGSLFDGQNIWLFPGNADRIVKLSPGSLPPTYQITEKFQNEAGVTLQSNSIKTVAAGASYIGTVPPISGYQYIGYKVNGGVLQTGAPTILGVNSNYEVVMVYKQNQTGYVKITGHFIDTNGMTIIPSQEANVAIGQNFSYTIPAIPGYVFRGYIVDNGSLQIFTTVTLYAVSSDHVITFIYEKVTSGCCCKVEKLCPVTYSTGQLIQVAHGLTIDTEKAFCDVRLQCVDPEAGYNVGDYIESFSLDFYEWGDTPARAKLTNDKISLQVGSANNGFLAVNTLGGQFRPTPSKWRLVFRIWYQ